MTTINAKYLRNNLKEVIDAVVNDNKVYTVIYRSKPVLQISKPVSYNEEEKGKSMTDILKKIEQYHKKNKKKLAKLQNTNYEEEYRKHLEKKYGYK
jgi:PHD/YefM family antitoxin component YafN of YafNO toxin-antitoxin module